MKVIINENQIPLVIRHFKTEVLKQMEVFNPCYYNDYFDFNKYKSDMINSSINEVVGELGIDERMLSKFKGELLNELGPIIRKHYNNFVKENCRPGW